MSGWLRRLRAAIVVGLTWGATWFAAGMVLLFIVGFGAADVPFPLFFGLLGFLAGVTFSGVLTLVERHSRFDQVSLPRFAGWGALGGVALASVFVPLSGQGFDIWVILSGIFGAAGAACAAGSLALARRAAPSALDEGVEEAGLTDAERRELLGDGR